LEKLGIIKKPPDPIQKKEENIQRRIVLEELRDSLSHYVRQFTID